MNRKLFTTKVLAVLIISISIFMACQQQPSLAPDLGSSIENQQSQSIRIIPFKDQFSGLKKVMTATSFVSWDQGGSLALFNESAPYISLSLEVPAQSIDQDRDISVNLETDLLQTNFGPHGTTFQDPAILNLEAGGLDLDGVDPASLGVYYIDEDTGALELMDTQDIQVDFDRSTVKVVNARIPHFSRYAIGTK